MRDVLAASMHEPYFPVPLERMHARIDFLDFEAGDELRPARDVRVVTTALNHPGGATGYRIEYRGRPVCHVTDVEHAEGRPDDAVPALIGAPISSSTALRPPTGNFPASLAGAVRPGRRGAPARGAGCDDGAMDALACALERARPDSLVAREGLVLSIWPSSARTGSSGNRPVR